MLCDALLQGAFILLVSTYHAAGEGEARLGCIESSDGREWIDVGGTIDSDPSSGERTLSFALELDSLRRGRTYRAVNARLLLTVRQPEDSATRANMRIGTRMHARGILGQFPRPRNPGEFDFGRYLELNAIDGVLFVPSFDSTRIAAVGDGRSWGAAVASAQHTIFGLFDLLHPHERASFLKGVVWGYRADISDELRQTFVDTGTIHILAVSGSNVAFVVMALSALLGLVRIPHRYRGWTAAAGLLAYMVLTGSSASVVRATIMGLLVIAGKGTERRTDVYNSIAAAAVALLLWNTGNLFDVGFQLSFSAVLSLVYFSVPLQHMLRRATVRFAHLAWIDDATSLFAVSLAAQIGTLPFTAYYFGRISVISVLANLLVVPVSGVNTILGFIEAVVAPLLPWAALCFAAANDALVWLLLLFVRAAAAVPGATVNIPTLGAVVVLAYYAVVLGCVHLHRRWVVKAFVFGGFAALAASMCWSISSSSSCPLTVTMLDVGQGDAILIETPHGRRVLIDTGPAGRGWDAGKKIIAPFLRRRGITQLDAVVLTHGHDDHVSGLPVILSSCGVSRLIVGLHPQLPRRVDSAIAVARSRGMHVDTVQAGMELGIDPAMRFYVLSPTPGLSTEQNLNTRSVTILACHKERTVLLTGDLNDIAEGVVSRVYGRFVHAEVLKAGHHGSGTSTTDGFLRLVHPADALVSVGANNRFGHPSSATMSRIRNAGVRVHRTDEHGAVVFQSDGARWTEASW